MQFSCLSDRGLCLLPRFKEKEFKCRLYLPNSPSLSSSANCPTHKPGGSHGSDHFYTWSLGLLIGLQWYLTQEVPNQNSSLGFSLVEKN